MNTIAQKQKSQLKEIANSEASIRQQVATEALQYGNEDITSFFSNLLTHGCISGMIGSLVYYHDTHEFFDMYYDEIEELRYEYEEQLGSSLNPNGDLKNWFAWFAFEETARKLAQELAIHF